MSDSMMQIWQEAWDRLPLPMLMTRIGDGHFTVKGAHCPFCQDTKKRFSVYKEGNRHFFKCFKPDCPANNPEHGHGELGYLALRTGKSLDDCKREYLLLALPERTDEINRIFESGLPSSVREPSERREAPIDPRLSSEPRNLWHLIWQRLALTGPDRESLKKKRGFTDETITRLGYRSNNQSNRPIIEAIAQEKGVEPLLEEGLYVEGERGPRPSGQLLGYGITGKKDSSDNEIWEITQPPIIPYLDESGVPFYLRPHKGGFKRQANEFEDDRYVSELLGQDPDCAAHVYCPFTLSDLVAEFDGRCILTEGEFKVGALFQTRIPACAAPGITFIRNATFRKELVSVLKKFGVREVIICFDNEVKDDPNFPDKYKPDPTKRWDTQVWAEYAALVLREHFKVRIGWLPNELRVDGKADFDGVLAGFVHGVKGHPVFSSALGLTDGTRAARRVFREVVEKATEKTPLDLFPSESRRIIEFKLQQLFYKPLVAAGGEREAKLAKKYGRTSTVSVLIDELPLLIKGEPIDEDLAQALRSVRGCYYDRESVRKEEYARLIAIKNKIEGALAAGCIGDETLTSDQRHTLKILLSAVFERLRGLPVPITNFVLSCEFKLHPSDGKAIRLVKIRNSDDSGKTAAADKLWRCAPTDLARVANFREWLLGTARGAARGMRDEHLQFLTIDMDKHSYLRDIFEVDHYGWHKETGIWFFGDSAYVEVPEKGTQRIEADHDNIFWHEGIGYQIDSSIDERGTTFEQGAPLLLSPQDRTKKENGEPRQIFTQLAQDLFDTIGGYEGWIALGIMLAYGAGPELLKMGGHPGNWLYGKMSSGKTTVARWLLRIWGFKHLDGIGIDDRTTHVGMNRFLAQYSCLPVWFDEYRRDQCDAQKESVIRGAFDRNAGAKGIADHSNRTRSAKLRTTPMITGETGSTDAATRSRYTQIHVSEHNRIGDGTVRYQRMQEDSKHYYQIGRFIMEHRGKFAEEVCHQLEGWMHNKEVRTAIPNERVRLVHGVAYVAMDALDTVLESKLQGLSDYFRFLLQHASESLAQVKQETFLNSFWRDVTNGLKTGKVHKKFFRVRYALVRPDGSIVKEENGNGRPFLYIDYGSVFNEYAQDKRSRNESVPLDVNSIGRELSKEPYFMPPPKRDGERCHRIPIDGNKALCWVISLSADSTSERTFPFIQDLVPIVCDEEMAKRLARDKIIQGDDEEDEVIAA